MINQQRKSILPRCSKCGSLVETYDNYCQKCGNSLKIKRKKELHEVLGVVSYFIWIFVILAIAGIFITQRAIYG